MAHATAPDWTRAVACVVTGEIADVLAMLPARCFSRLNARYPSAAAICQCIRAAFAAAGICNRAIRRFVSLHTASCASSTYGRLAVPLLRTAADARRRAAGSRRPRHPQRSRECRRSRGWGSKNWQCGRLSGTGCPSTVTGFVAHRCGRRRQPIVWHTMCTCADNQRPRDLAVRMLGDLGSGQGALA